MSLPNHVQTTPLGQGGFGEVHKGWFIYSHVAIKILSTLNRDAKRKFFAEVERAWRIRHPNLVHVSCVGPPCNGLLAGS
jgi:hypothetical protein